MHFFPAVYYVPSFSVVGLIIYSVPSCFRETFVFHLPKATMALQLLHIYFDFFRKLFPVSAICYLVTFCPQISFISYSCDGPPSHQFLPF